MSMNFPWVQRELWEAAEKLRAGTEARLAVSEALRQQLAEELAAARAEAQAAREAAGAERQRLTDRLLTMAGQPALYVETPAPAVATAKPSDYDVKDLAKARALPSAGVTFSGVHAAAREAMQNGTFNIDRARPRL